MTKIKFFACSVGEPGKDYVEGNLERILKDKAFVLHESTPQPGVYNDIRSGDILILKYNHQFIAYGKTTGIITSDHIEWNLRAPVIEWIFKNPDNPKVGVSKNGIGYETLGGGMYGTVKELTQKFGLIKMKEINNKSQIYLEILKEIQHQLEVENMQDKIKLLKYKKQIILQGPPGTGKTRLAKMMAKEMTSPLISQNPLNLIEDFFKNYKDTDPDSIKKRQIIKSTLENFQKRFPISSLKELSLEDYCVGKGNRDNFCWWIETGLKELGRYSPGKANHYLIYYSTSKDGYSKNGALVKNIDNDEEAMKMLASILFEVVSNKDFEKGSKYFGDSFLLKIFNSYYPDEYFPINGRNYLDNVLSILGIDSRSINKELKNLRLNQEFIRLKSKYKSDMSSFEFMSFLFNTFNLKEGIETIEDKKVINKGETKLIQFHPSYTYEDFVRGITANINADSQVEYKVENKSLSQFAERALDNPSANYVLIIDEINRANLSSVLGELIYALEYRFDSENPNETTVDSMYSIADADGTSESYEEGKKLKLPTNLFIIGTMNTADRSVGHIDYAIRRRFAFVDILPTTEPLNSFALPYFKKVSELFVKNYDTIDWSNLESSEYLANDFRPEDVWIGHSYFIADSDAELKIKLKYEVMPILKEYLKDGILLESARAIIYGIS